MPKDGGGYKCSGGRGNKETADGNKIKIAIIVIVSICIAIMAIVLGILQFFYGNKIPCEFIWKTIDNILIYTLILMSMNMKI